MNATTKMISLHTLRDEVFSARSDSFHWDLGLAVEMNRMSGRHLNEKSGRVVRELNCLNIQHDVEK